MTDNFMTIEEFCGMIGISRNTFYRRKADYPTLYRVGRRSLLKRQEVQEWLRHLEAA